MLVIHVTERRRMSGISSKSVIGQMLCEFYCSPGYHTASPQNCSHALVPETLFQSLSIAVLPEICKTKALKTLKRRNPISHFVLTI